MRKVKQSIHSSILHRLLLCIFLTGAISVLFFPSVSQAGWFSSEKSPEEIAKDYGEAVVLIAAFDKDGQPLTQGSVWWQSETPWGWKTQYQWGI
ncbi:MAG: hypothetical protein ACYSTI_10485 [Planctomycetota bacterium]|jgi:hypothetical protein